MKPDSATTAKGGRRGQGLHDQRAPRDGSRLRAVYDTLWEARGTWVPLSWRTLGFPHAIRMNAAVRNLELVYGLDIRCSGRGRHASKYILAGEWVGNRYIDYVALAAIDEPESLLKEIKP